MQTHSPPQHPVSVIHFGELFSIVPQELESILSSAQVMAARSSEQKQSSRSLYREESCLVAEGAVYLNEHGNPRLYFTSGQKNPIFNHLHDSRTELQEKGFFSVPSQDISSIVHDQHTLTVDLLNLDTSEMDSYSSFFDVSTNDISHLNKTQVQIITRLFGRGPQLRSHLHMLREDGQIDGTRIYLANPKYIASLPEGSAIAYPCRLSNFENRSDFAADHLTNFNSFLLLQK